MLSCVQLFVTPWTAAHQASLSITNSQTHVYWVGDAIRPSHSLSSPSSFPSLQSFPASGSFQMSQFFESAGQSIGISASASVLPMNIQGWFPLGLTGWISMLSKGLSRVFSNTTIFRCSAFFIVQLLYPYMTTGKTVVLARRTFVDNVMSLLFNMLSRFAFQGASTF